MYYPVNLKERYATREELITTFVEVETLNRDQFLKVRETLTRIGIANKDKNTLYQSCHVLHKKGKYYLVHFKELFGLDRRDVEMSAEDYRRRNAIALSLQKWGLVKLKTVDILPAVDIDKEQLFFVISHKEKTNWTLECKYSVGKKFNAPQDS